MKLRDGSKAFLKYDDRKEPAVLSGEIKLGKYPINGYKACSPTNADCSGESWTEGGKYLQYKEGNFDIIGAWVEPRPTRIINGIEVPAPLSWSEFKPDENGEMTCFYFKWLNGIEGGGFSESESQAFKTDQLFKTEEDAQANLDAYMKGSE